MDLFASYEARRDCAIRAGREISDDGAEPSSRRLDRVILAIESLSEILHERYGIGLDEILERMDEIDLRDGRLDGRLAGRVISCPACDRPNSRLAKTCVYCGHRHSTPLFTG